MSTRLGSFQEAILTHALRVLESDDDDQDRISRGGLTLSECVNLHMRINNGNQKSAQSATSRAVKSLEQKGYMVRRTMGDGHAILAELTNSGFAMAQALSRDLNH